MARATSTARTNASVADRPAPIDAEAGRPEQATRHTNPPAKGSPMHTLPAPTDTSTYTGRHRDDTPTCGWCLQTLRWSGERQDWNHAATGLAGCTTAAQPNGGTR